jgi:phage shock protein PspC (stress-responsive transcriptional regulator)
MSDPKNLKLTWGQVLVLVVTSLPMAAAGVAGGIASYFNFADVLASKSNARSLVLAGEGVAVICALVTLALTLMGQHTPAAARAGLWLVPLAASVAGLVIAPDLNTKVAMGLSPLAMTAAGEGIALVARRIVAYRTGVDIEQQRRSGLLLWHANRSQNGGWYGKRASKLAVWRLTRQFAETDSQMSVQLGEVQRYRITEGADVNLAAALAGKATKAAELPRAVPATPAAPELPAAPSQPVQQAPVASGFGADDPDGYGFVKGVLAEAEEQVATDTTVKLLTVADVADMKGVAPGTVRSWVNRGKLPVHERDADGRSLFHPLTVADLD